MEVANDAVMGHIEDWRRRIGIDGDDGFGVFHSDNMRNGSGDTAGKIDFGVTVFPVAPT